MALEEIINMRDKIRLAEEFIDLFLPEQALEVMPTEWLVDVDSLTSALALRARNNWIKTKRLRANSEEDKHGLRHIRENARETYERILRFQEEWVAMNSH